MAKMNFKKLFRFELGSVFLVLFGALLLFNPDFGSAALATILGWVLVGGGGVGLLIGFLSWPGLGLIQLLGSVLLLGGGIYLLCNPLTLASIIGIVLGLLLMSQGLGSLWDALRVKRYGGFYQVSLFLGIGMAALGVYLVMSPLATSRFVMSIAGLVMIVCGITNLISHYRAGKFIDRSRQKIIGKQDTPDIIDADQ